MANRIRNRVGERMGKITVVSQAPSIRNAKGRLLDAITGERARLGRADTHWNIICDCGNTRTYSVSTLRKAKTCGSRECNGKWKSDLFKAKSLKREKRPCSTVRHKIERDNLRKENIILGEKLGIEVKVLNRRKTKDKSVGTSWTRLMSDLRDARRLNAYLKLEDSK